MSPDEARAAPTSGPPILLQPIGFVRSTRREAQDDDWESVRSRIELVPEFAPEALDGIEAFSHLEVLFCFHRVRPEDVERGARHPRGIRAGRGSASSRSAGAAARTVWERRSSNCRHARAARSA